MHSLRRSALSAPSRQALRPVCRAAQAPVSIRRFLADASAPAATAQTETPAATETKETESSTPATPAKKTPPPQPKYAKTNNKPKNQAGNGSNNGAPANTDAILAEAQKPFIAKPSTWGSQNPNQIAKADPKADIDWTTSFQGIATVPVTKEQYDVIARPLNIDDIEVKPEGIAYLPEIKYRRRLNEAFGPMGWGLVPRGEANVGGQIVTREYALIVNGRFVSQAQGENSFFSDDQLPSSIEGCKSNALMRCCKDLGIGSELWDPVFLRAFRTKHMTDVWVEHSLNKKKRQMWFKNGQVNIAYPWKRS